MNRRPWLSALSPGTGTGRHLVMAVGVSGMLYAAHLVLLLAVAVVLARVLGPDQLGVYAYTLAILNILSVFVRLGLSVLLMRETARAQSRGDWALMRGLWSWAARIALVAGLLLTLATIGAAELAGEALSAERRHTLYAGLAIASLVAFGHLLNGTLRGLQKVVAALTPELVVRPALQLGLLLGALWLAGSVPLDAPGAMLLNTAATAVSVAAGLAILWRLAPAEVKAPGPMRREVPVWVRAAMPMAASIALFQVYDQTAMLVLGNLGTDRETGLFRVVLQVALLGNYASLPFAMVATPMFSKLHAEGDTPGLQRIVTATVRGASGLILVLFIGACFLGEWFLGRVFGAAYAAGFPELIVLGIGYLLASLCGPAPDLMNMTGFERLHMRWMAVSAAANITLCTALVPSLGGMGAAIGLAVSMVGYRAAMMLAARARLGIDTTPLGRPPRPG